MVRELKEIKKDMTSSFMANETLSSVYEFELNADFEREFSKVSIENIIFNIVSYSIWLLEKLFSKHKSEVEELISQQKAHTANWYKTIALRFQYGFNLQPNSDKFDNTGKSEEDIEKSKIIKYAAAVESPEERTLVLKIATEKDNNLNRINDEELTSFSYYISRVKDAGVKIRIVNHHADILRIKADIYVNPLLVDNAGKSILNGDKLVEQAIKNYLQNLPFNGELRLQELSNAIEKLEGVEIVDLQEVSSHPDGQTDFENLKVRKVPQSGYFKLENYEGLTYIYI